MYPSLLVMCRARRIKRFQGGLEFSISADAELSATVGVKA